jgi:hypothetical protein
LKKELRIRLVVSTVALKSEDETAMNRFLVKTLIADLWAALSTMALAQNAPAPGPTNPLPPNPQAQPGANMVINPTEQECRRGWNPSLKWTKQQFEEFCTRLGASR